MNNKLYNNTKRSEYINGSTVKHIIIKKLKNELLNARVISLTMVKRPIIFPINLL